MPFALLAGCSDHEDAPVVEGWERVRVDFPPPWTEGTPFPLPRLSVPYELWPKAPPIGVAPTGWANLALHQPVTSSDPEPIIGSLTLVNDGEKSIGEGYYVELMDGPHWVQIEMEEESTVYVVWLWHSAGRDNLLCHDVVVEISSDPEFRTGVTQVFNNDYDNSSGHGLGRDAPYLESNYGKVIQVDGVPGRYVRCHHNGSTLQDTNRYVEIEVYGLPSTVPLVVTPEEPTDPLASVPPFREFEAAYWATVYGPDAKGWGAVDMWLEEDRQLVILSSRPLPMAESHQQRFRKEWMSELETVVRLWDEHFPAWPLQRIEVRDPDGAMITTK